ncbi:vacuolar protein sorting-associated protein 28 homolog 2 [Diospyros lotus]|uniref:vacuolar protein sorting-associated protein 28 homolog 2 n=1 Tax=Diospyros lotus TaxID=55363 RepID=UPI002258D5C3|nr:vacuolar protein sorting-associated protein 28 homolog 2 [Diospyros lotus]
MEVKPWHDKLQREVYENFAVLYAIIKATEELEKAHVRDIVLPAERKRDCQKQIARFKALASTLKTTVPSFERFHEDHDTYKMDCLAASNCFILSGDPETVEYRAAEAMPAANLAASVAEYALNFIMAMGVWELNMVAISQVHQLPSELSASVNKLTIVAPDFEVKTNMEWITRFLKTRAANELTEKQARQLHFDLEYNPSMAALPTAGT